MIIQDMQDKNFLVSGASRGIGKAIALDILSRGGRVVVVSRSEPDYVSKYGSAVYWHSVDIANRTQVSSFVSDAYRRFGNISGLVNNAGVNYDSLVTQFSNAYMQEMINVNLLSAFYVTQAVVKGMLIQRTGSIVNIGSIVGGKRGYAGAAVYGATKAALNGLTISLARELGSKGIRVNAVLPGFVDTNMTSGMNDQKRQQILRRTPLGRFAITDDITGIVSFLLSPRSSFITGQIIAVDGGLTC